MFNKSFSSRVKDLAILSDDINLKILCTIRYIEEKGNDDCIDKDLLDLTDLTEEEIKKHVLILKETKCIETETKNIPNMSEHIVFKLTPYGEKLLKQVGINKNVVRNVMNIED